MDQSINVFAHIIFKLRGNKNVPKEKNVINVGYTKNAHFLPYLSVKHPVTCVVKNSIIPPYVMAEDCKATTPAAKPVEPKLFNQYSLNNPAPPVPAPVNVAT